jgi:phosphohistidine swiveling domain-containing protein
MKDYSRLTPENYDFLWRVGLNYLFYSFFKNARYEGADFIFYFENNKTLTMFLGKEDRARFSALGLELYTNGFNDYKKDIETKLPIHDEKIHEIITEDMSLLSNHELSMRFADTIDFCTGLWKDYFFTDYFATDLIERVLSEKDPRYDFVQLQKNSDEMAKLKYLQRERINKIFYPGGIVDIYAQEAKKRLELKFDVSAYNYAELSDLLHGKTVDVPDRSSNIIFGLFSGNVEIIGPEAKRLFEQLEKIDSSISEFKGSIGSKGYAKGRVKKIHFGIETDYLKEIDAMNQGDILVSGSTGPEMILACKKAAAIITDEGGIISHAALVSRELGIPAVIGTKIATKVLKDGDIVEVDANNGIVRIIK